MRAQVAACRPLWRRSNSPRKISAPGLKPRLRIGRISAPSDRSTRSLESAFRRTMQIRLERPARIDANKARPEAGPCHDAGYHASLNARPTRSCDKRQRLGKPNPGRHCPRRAFGTAAVPTACHRQNHYGRFRKCCYPSMRMENGEPSPKDMNIVDGRQSVIELRHADPP